MNRLVSSSMIAGVESDRLIMLNLDYSFKALIILAGTPPTIVFASIFLVTAELGATTDFVFITIPG